MPNNKKVEAQVSETQVSETPVSETQAPTKQFAINVESLINGKKEMFTLSGPESAPLGLVYDVSHRILSEVTKIMEKKNESLKASPIKDEQVQPEVVDKAK